MAAPKKKKKNAPGQEKTFTFTFTMPEVIGLCAGGVAALCAFFVLGILLGRGYQPEKDMPEIAMMLPSQASNASGEVKGGVLKPEELDYIDQLKKKPEPAVQPQKEEPKKEVAKVENKDTSVKISRSVKTASSAAAKKAVETATAQQVEVDPPVEIDNPVEVDAPQYNYIYQAASFGDNARAQTFADKLIASGLDSYVEPGKSGTRTWYRVFVRHTGTADSTSGMKKVLAKYGIKKPLLKSKKAI
ncbi:SPOR domain-containing protein [Desulfovibrio sp. JC010]|uniref:SPOR domain-containing protein n=1 Tax=Desulfovibrio sp. JC010 TaxID=2593641 RepID=UPI0013D628F9|nr:SPOR domain-containing protein [Desulfovibrio sp. JC010]NDV28902.1 SPOR domain-containing protein [Desulfovibrio sp. JC010]